MEVLKYPVYSKYSNFGDCYYCYFESYIELGRVWILKLEYMEKQELCWACSWQWQFRTAVSVRVCVLSCFSCARFSVTLRTVACQPPLSMRFSRQESWSRWSFPSSGRSSYPGDRAQVSTSPALTGGFFIDRATWDRGVFHVTAHTESSLPR